MNDYANPLLTLRHMLKTYEQLLVERRWADAVDMGPDLIAQMRLLVQTVRIQAEETRL
jgi:hypothetical protein